MVRLDRPAEAAAFDADADAALRGLSEPVLLDEWQTVPAVLGAVKRAVDDDPRPGRFLLTGSVRAHHAQEVWPGTGRLVRLELLPLSQRELAGRADGPGLIQQLLDDPSQLPSRADPPDLRGYVELAVRGGFPEAALRLGETARQAWATSHLEQLVTRDLASLGEERDPVKLRRYFDVLAANHAGVVDDRTLYEAAGINRRTAEAYERLLSELFVLAVMPAWWTNRLKRLVKGSKRYLVDGALAAAALGQQPAGIMADGDLLGRFLDGFVAAQIRSELVTPAAGRLHHLRQQQGRRAVDLIVERGGRLAACEIKATAAPRPSDARHLAWLRDELGDRFAAGVVFHTGPRTFELGERLFALPVATLWS